jgi:two-component system sensor histidine kinase KdpD
MAWLRTAREHLLAMACVLASTLCAFLLRDYAPIADLAMIQLLGVMMVAARFSVRASVVACVAGRPRLRLLLDPAAFRVRVDGTRSSLTFIAMLVVAFMISSLNQRLRDQEQAARATAFRAQALHQLSAELSGTNDPMLLAVIAARHLEKLFSARVTVLRAQAHDLEVESREVVS